MIAAAIGIGVVALIVRTWRRINMGLLDAVTLATKVAVSNPRSARDWPELTIVAVVVSPTDQSESLVEVIWPGRPGNRAVLVVHLDDHDHRDLRLLRSWQVQGASILPMPLSSFDIELRRRGSLDRIRATVVAESYWQAS